MTLQQLSYFLAAEHGSFTAAADSLHLARPSLSEQIARLEAELGVPLFVRAGRRLELTDVGASCGRRPNGRSPPRRARTLTDCVAGFGMFSTAHHFQRIMLIDLVEDFSRRLSARAGPHPRPELLRGGDAVRDGRLEAGLVELPINDEELDVGAPVSSHARPLLRPSARRAARPKPATRSTTRANESKSPTRAPVSVALRRMPHARRRGPGASCHRRSLQANG